MLQAVSDEVADMKPLHTFELGLHLLPCKGCELQDELPEAPPGIENVMNCSVGAKDKPQMFVELTRCLSWRWRRTTRPRASVADTSVLAPGSGTQRFPRTHCWQVPTHLVGLCCGEGHHFVAATSRRAEGVRTRCALSFVLHRMDFSHLPD